MNIRDWFLTKAERGNPATRVDAEHPGDQAWSTGNSVEPLVHGARYFAHLYDAIEATGTGDLILFADWRGDRDERLTDDAGSSLGDTLRRASDRGAVVRGLAWRSHLDEVKFQARANRRLGEAVTQAGGDFQLDLRVRPMGSHHQKFVVIRHMNAPERDIAYVGGIDLCHGRRDTIYHRGDPQAGEMAEVYGDTPPWHDVQVALRGPVVRDVETVFRERWEDPTPPTHNVFRLLRDKYSTVTADTMALPPQEPAPPAAGECAIQLLRTYPDRLRGYPFAPDGERSVARGYRKVLARAERLIYLEDQFLWGREVAEVFAETLRAHPDLHVVAVLPHHPDHDGPLNVLASCRGREEAMELIEAAAPGRFHLFGIENEVWTPIYVHSKVCVVDDIWASVGSDNFNRRSWTHDSELAAAILAEGGDRSFARDLRLELVAEHLGRGHGEQIADDEGHLPAQLVEDLVDAQSMVAAMHAAASALQAWHDGGCQGDRPVGRLRPLDIPDLNLWEKSLGLPIYRGLHDPEGRPHRMRRRGKRWGPLRGRGRY